MKLLLVLPFIFCCFTVLAYDQLCPSVQIKNLKKLDFTSNEERLLCGDKKTPAWKSIPVYQARFFLIGFLQARGYLKPKLEIKKGILYADAGEKSRVEKITVQAEVPKLEKKVQKELKHLYKKRILSTQTLDSVEAEGLGQIRNRGYPCAKVESAADIDTNEVTLQAENLDYHKFGIVEKEAIPGLRDNALDRYYPFGPSDPFNAELLKLTEKRMTRAEVVQGTYFLEECKGEDFKLHQQFIVGPPRTLRYGIGASTELGPMARIRWSHNRYKSMASILAAQAQASLRSQSLTFSADAFFWHGHPRRSLFTQLEFLRESQVDYEQTVYRITPLMKWTRDSEGFHKTYTLGPSFETGSFFSQNSSLTRHFGTGSLLGNLQWMSHEYELFDIHPEKGQLFTFNFDFRHPGFGFIAPLLKLDTSAVHIDRISNWGRGALVGAIRLNLGSTWVNTSQASLAELPPVVKFFGGGSDDIRGFYLRTLPRNNGLGALTRAAMKLELRRTYLFIKSLEGFAFVDGGYFGETSWTLNRELYYSPGFGVRWLSPIGLVQAYAARALVSNPSQDSGNFYYLGIGGTF